MISLPSNDKHIYNSNHNSDQNSLLNSLLTPQQQNLSQIHIRIKQRTARTYITCIEGIDIKTHDIKKLLAFMRKKLSCNGFIKNDNEIHLTGDQRETIKKLLIEQEIAQAQNIKIHGF